MVGGRVGYRATACKRAGTAAHDELGTPTFGFRATLDVDVSELRIHHLPCVDLGVTVLRGVLEYGGVLLIGELVGDENWERSWALKRLW